MTTAEGTYVDKIARGPHYEVLTTDAIASMDLQFKVVIVGDSGCGKTSLFNSYIRGTFPREYEPTIFENHRSFVQRQEGLMEVLSADLWDTAGQEEYERLRRLSYQDADLVIIAYNVNARESLSNIPEVWALEALTYSPGAQIILVGLKSDMDHHVDVFDAERVAREIGAVAHVQCSSISNYNVNGVFDAVFNAVYNRAKVISGQQQHQNTISQKGNKKGNGGSKPPKTSKAGNSTKRKRSRRCVIL